MNKKDFWILVLCNITTLILLIEHWCGVPLALEFMCVTSIISMIVHVCILKDYIRFYSFVKEDHTR